MATTWAMLLLLLVGIVAGQVGDDRPKPPVTEPSQETSSRAPGTPRPPQTLDIPGTPQRPQMLELERMLRRLPTLDISRTPQQPQTSQLERMLRQPQTQAIPRTPRRPQTADIPEALSPHTQTPGRISLPMMQAALEEATRQSGPQHGVQTPLPSLIPPMTHPRSTGSTPTSIRELLASGPSRLKTKAPVSQPTPGQYVSKSQTIKDLLKSGLTEKAKAAASGTSPGQSSTSAALGRAPDSPMEECDAAPQVHVPMPQLVPRPSWQTRRRPRFPNIRLAPPQRTEEDANVDKGKAQPPRSRVRQRGEIWRPMTPNDSSLPTAEQPGGEFREQLADRGVDLLVLSDSPPPTAAAPQRPSLTICLKRRHQEAPQDASSGSTAKELEKTYSLAAELMRQDNIPQGACNSGIMPETTKEIHDSPETIPDLDADEAPTPSHGESYQGRENIPQSSYSSGIPADRVRERPDSPDTIPDLDAEYVPPPPRKVVKLSQPSEHTYHSSDSIPKIEEVYSISSAQSKACVRQQEPEFTNKTLESETITELEEMVDSPPGKSETIPELEEVVDSPFASSDSITQLEEVVDTPPGSSDTIPELEEAVDSPLGSSDTITQLEEVVDSPPIHSKECTKLNISSRPSTDTIGSSETIPALVKLVDSTPGSSHSIPELEAADSSPRSEDTISIYEELVDSPPNHFKKYPEGQASLRPSIDTPASSDSIPILEEIVESTPGSSESMPELEEFVDSPPIHSNEYPRLEISSQLSTHTPGSSNLLPDLSLESPRHISSKQHSGQSEKVDPPALLLPYIRRPWEERPSVNYEIQESSNRELEVINQLPTQQSSSNTNDSKSQNLPTSLPSFSALKLSLKNILFRPPETQEMSDSCMIEDESAKNNQSSICRKPPESADNTLRSLSEANILLQTPPESPPEIAISLPVSGPLPGLSSVSLLEPQVLLPPLLPTPPPPRLTIDNTSVVTIRNASSQETQPPVLPSRLTILQSGVKRPASSSNGTSGKTPNPEHQRAGLSAFSEISRQHFVVISDTDFQVVPQAPREAPKEMTVRDLDRIFGTLDIDDSDRQPEKKEISYCIGELQLAILGPRVNPMYLIFVSCVEDAPYCERPERCLPVRKFVPIMRRKVTSIFEAPTFRLIGDPGEEWERYLINLPSTCICTSRSFDRRDTYLHMEKAVDV